MTSSAELPNKMSAGFREWLFALGVSLGTALLVIAPFFWLGNASGHDFGFHAASWLDAAGQWKEGIFFPRWTEWANHGFGEPRFIFYPPLSWMLGAALSFVAPWNAVPGGFIVIVQTMAGLCSFAWAALEKKSMQPLLRGAGGLALGFALASFYLAPAAYEQRWVNIGQVLSLGLQPADNFLYTMGNDPEHNVFNWIASSVAVLLLVMTGIAAIAALQRTTQGHESDDKKKLWRMLLVLSAAAAILMVRQSAFFWAHLPKLRFVQFPWRWMAILAVPYAYFSAAAMMRQRMRWIWFALVLIAVCGTATVLVKKTWWDSDDIPSLQEAVANDQGFEGTDEYDPVGDDHTNLPEKSPRVQVLPAEESGGSAPQAEIRIERWTAEEGVVRVNSNEPVRVGLRLLD